MTDNLLLVGVAWKDEEICAIRMKSAKNNLPNPRYLREKLCIMHYELI